MTATRRTAPLQPDLFGRQQEPKWLIIVALVIAGFIVIVWALSHLVWVFLGVVIGYFICESVHHYANRPTIGWARGSRRP